jgi:cardiolipin synthase
LTDAVDGYVARQFNQKTVLGSYIDPLADKLLLLCGFLSLSLMKHLPDSMRIPAWVTIPVVTRDIIILIGSAMIFLTTGKFTARPIVIGKVTTFFQMATLLTVLLGLTSDIQFLLFVATVSLTVLSGIQYFRMATNLLGTE